MMSMKKRICLGMIVSLALTGGALAAEQTAPAQAPQKAPMHKTQKHTPASKEAKFSDVALKGCLMQAKANNHLRHKKSFNDKAFLSAMIPHHEASIKAANEVLKNGKDPQVKSWAEAVVAGEEAELKQMKQLVATMGGVDPQATAMMQDSMQAIPAMSQDPDVNFVEVMIGQRASAVEMAASAVISSTNKDITKLAGDIVQAQLDDILAYRNWLVARDINP